MRFRRPLSLWSVPPWPGKPGAREDAAPVILLYHSVMKATTDPWGVRVRPRNFIEQMAVISKHCHVMPLAELDSALRSGGLPPRTVLVTFDDGYVDNLIHAKPAMLKHGVPGTVFVASGYIDSPSEYWWDELDRLILQAGELPASITLTVAGREMHWSLGEDAKLNWLGMRRHHRHWYAYDDAQRTRPRQVMFHELWSALRASPSVAERERVLEDLRRMARPALAPRATHRCCTTAQLRQLAEGGTIEIGAHTVNHPSLGHITVDEQRREIVESKAALEQTLQAPVHTFSYPFGTKTDYTPDTIAILKEAGFKQTCSNFPETVRRDVDRFQYPRRVVDDWDGATFAAKLAKWFAEDTNAIS